MANNENIPKALQIVIQFVGPDGHERWVGSWTDFRREHEDATILNVETLKGYTVRLKPLNDNHGKEN